MRLAIVISFVIHMAALSLVFKGPRAGEHKYPAITIVKIVSPPPARGAQQPQVQQAVKEKPKQQKNIQKTPEDPRTVDINKKKKQRPEQKPKPPPPEQEEPRQETQESKNKGLPDGVDLGSEFGSARLDAAGFDSPTYLNILFGKISREWDNPFEGDESIKCVIYFEVNREGRILDSAVETPSGYEAYDQAALRAVLGTRPPPLPNQYDSDHLGIHLEFRYVPEY